MFERCVKDQMVICIGRKYDVYQWKKHSPGESGSIINKGNKITALLNELENRVL